MSFYTMHGENGVLITDGNCLMQSVTTDFTAAEQVEFGKMWHAWSSVPFDAPERYDESLAAEVVDRLNIRSRKRHENGYWENPRHLVERYVGARVWAKDGEAHYGSFSVKPDAYDEDIETLTYAVEQYEATLAEVSENWREFTREDFVGGYRHTRDLWRCASKHLAIIEERTEKLKAGHLCKPAIISNGEVIREADPSTEYLLERALTIPDD